MTNRIFTKISGLQFAPETHSTIHCAIIEADILPGTYEVYMIVASRRVTVNTPAGYKLAHYSATKQLRGKSLREITDQFMAWKFSPYIEKCESTIPDRIFCIKNDLSWIVSIISVEFDYHVGEKNCLRSANKEILNTYSKVQLAGYGAEYLPKAGSITDSRLTKYMLPPAREQITKARTWNRHTRKLSTRSKK